MANPIQRLVQLVLDRRAAQKTEAEAKKSLKGIEGGLSSLRSLALKVGAALAAAFGTRALFNFLKDSIKVGAEAQGIWNRLGQAVENAGIKYAAVEQDIHRVANAMQAATKVGDEDFAAILTELITTSGDYQKSLENVSTVVNLATAKQIDFKSAAMLVGRAMVGQTQTLTRYGIVVKEGEDAMEVLRRTFRGMAENEVNTFEGKLAQVNNQWMDFKQALGEALIAGANGTSILDRLTQTIKSLTEAVDVFGRAYGGVSETAFRNEQAITRIVAKAETPEKAAIGLKMFRQTTEMELEKARANLASMTGTWNTIKGVAKTGDLFKWRTEVDSAQETVDGLVETLAHLDRVMQDLASGKETVGIKIEPTVIKRIPIEQLTQRTLGPPDLAPLAKPTAPGVQLGPVTQVWENLNHQLDVAHTLAQATGGDFDSLQNQASLLTSAMQALAEMGIGATDARMQGLAERLREVQAESIRVQKEQELMGKAGQTAGEILNAAMGAGIGPLAAWKAKQNAVLALEQTVQGFVATLNPFTAPLAAGHYAAAAQFAGIAAAWGALAAATGGFKGGGGGGGVGGGGYAGGRDRGGPASQRAEPVGPELNVYFTGEGFDAINPKVQRIIYNGMQEAQKSIGGNARVRTFRGNVPTTGG